MLRMCKCMGCMGELDIERDTPTEIKTTKKEFNYYFFKLEQCLLSRIRDHSV